VSGFMDTGEAVPYGEPATFAQKMKNLFGSNALPGPINGPHLPVARIRCDKRKVQVQTVCESDTA
jgi:hypothetical protein